MWGRLFLGAVFVFVLALIAFVSVAAAESVPVRLYGGSMMIGTVEGPDEAAEFEWEVRLGERRELVQEDERTLLVVYKDDGHVSFEIEAEEAHAADGAAVPTTVSLTGPNTFLFVVHHQEGDPAAGGAPFDYPVMAGSGWAGGFQTHRVELPPGEPSPTVATPLPTCLVPKLTGKTVQGARRSLRRSHCSLGTIRGKRTRSARIVHQRQKPGASLAAGAGVGVKVAG